MGAGGDHSGNEERRLAALYGYRILDTPEEAAYDRLTELAARIFRAPLAVISLVDRDRHWFKSHYGTDIARGPRPGSFCSHAILSDQVMLVEDASTDERFRHSPIMIGSLEIRFYAGAPLIAPEGLRLGTLAVLDTQPRFDWSAEDDASLTDLASMAMHEMNLGRELDHWRGTGRAASESDARFRALMESASQSIVAVNHRGVIELVNQKVEEMFGYSRDEMLGRPLEMLLPERLAQSHAAHRKDYFSRPRARPMGIGMDLAGRRKTGQEFPVEISLNYVEVGGQALSIAFVTDISERVRLEQQLRQAQKMEAIGQLAGGVAHDFNNLLTVIHGYSAMSLDGLPPDDALREPLEEIEKAAVSAAGLTRQLLMFSRRQVARPKILALNDVIAQIDKMLRRVIGEDVELILECGEEVGTIRADPGWIEQILMNLAVNARDAMPNGGTLIIETANLFLDQEYAETHLAVKTGLYAMLAVSDTGTGMTPEVQARIFEPFFTTKTPGEGTGLGLATVYGIVQQMGGTVWVYSEVNKGSTFKILMPVAQPGEVPELPAEVTVETGVGGTILLVEDEAGVRRFVRGMLEKKGYRVLEGADPVAALNFAGDAGVKIDLLLTDVVMPKMNGPELVERILAMRPGLPVLFMSGYTDRAARVQDRFANDVAFVQKPFTPHMLARKIQEVMRKRAEGGK